MPLYSAIGLVLASCALTFVPRCSAEPPEPAKPDAAVSKLRKASETAEVHGIGVNEPRHNRLEDLRDWPNFVKLVRTKNGPAGRVWELLPAHAQKRLSDDKLVERLNDAPKARDIDGALGAMKGGIASDLRKMIDNPDFYTEGAFKGMQLPKELKDAIALGRKRTALQTARLNWALLDVAFPNCLPELPDRFRTVRVQVVAGADVVLVLSSCERCRWEITLREGAKVTGILLCGYHALEVSGVDVPVVYRAYYGPDGVSLAHPHGYFYAPPKSGNRKFNEDEEEHSKKFLAGVKENTGKELTSFQSEYRPGPDSEPYVIRPVGK